MKRTIFILLTGLMLGGTPALAACFEESTMLASAISARAETDLVAATAGLEDALACHPESRGVRLELAMTYAWQNRFEEARTLYRMHLEEQPDDRGALLGHARVLAWAGERRAAAKLYDQLLALDPNDLEALNGRAFVAHARFRLGRSARLYQRVLRIDPSNREATEALQRVRATRRFETHVYLGALMVADGQRVVGNRAGALYRLSDTWSLSGTVSATSRFGENAGHVPSLAVTVQHRIGDSGSIALGYRASRDTGRLSLSASRKLGKPWTVLASIQVDPAALSEGGRLISAGLQRQITSTATALLQVYSFRGPAGFASISVVAGVRWQVGPARFAANLSDYRDDFRHSRDYAAQVTLPIRAVRVGLQAGGSLQEGRPRFGLTFGSR